MHNKIKNLADLHIKCYLTGLRKYFQILLMRSDYRYNYQVLWNILIYK
jgi:hypothetical protein